MLPVKKLSSYQNNFFILASFWLLLQIFLYFHFGIVASFEAEKYVAQADYFLKHGHYETGNFLFYSTEILLIATCKKLQVGYWPVIAIQLICNALSIFYFYKLIQKFTGKPAVAFWFTLLFLSMYYYQLYNVHLFTESLYFSFSILFFYRLIQIQKLTLYSAGVILIGLSALYLTRPVGIFFIPATFLFLTYRFYPKKALRIFSTAGVALLLIFYFALNQSLNSGGELDFLLPYLDERIICGVPTISTPHQIHVPVEQDSVQGLFYIITHNWKLFATLSVKRLVAFFGVLRSYYSFPHNFFIGAYFYTTYLLIFAGMKKWGKALRPEIAFMLCLIFFTAITTALSCDEWHNRFIFTILPFLLILASFTFIKKPVNTSSNANAKTQ